MPKTNTMSDTTLMQYICQGDHLAFQTLLTRHHQTCYRIAWRAMFSKNDAEDIVQECFLKIWQRPHLWDTRRNNLFTTWLYRVIVNACYDANRKQSHFTLVAEIDYTAIMPEASQEENQTKLIESLQQLTTIQQQIINLFYYEALSTQQTADILKLSPKSIESHLARARKKLALLLKSSPKISTLEMETNHALFS